MATWKPSEIIDDMHFEMNCQFKDNDFFQINDINKLGKDYLQDEKMASCINHINPSIGRIQTTSDIHNNGEDSDQITVMLRAAGINGCYDVNLNSSTTIKSRITEKKIMHNKSLTILLDEKYYQFMTKSGEIYNPPKNNYLDDIATENRRKKLWENLNNTLKVDESETNDINQPTRILKESTITQNAFPPKEIYMRNQQKNCKKKKTNWKKLHLHA